MLIVEIDECDGLGWVCDMVVVAVVESRVMCVDSGRRLEVCKGVRVAVECVMEKTMGVFREW